MSIKRCPETLVNHPVLNSYYHITREERYELGIIDELVRLSVGLEIRGTSLRISNLDLQISAKRVENIRLLPCLLTS